MMLQRHEGGDYVVCTGVSRSVRELVEAAFAVVDLDPEPYLVVDPAFVRPPDPVALVGDPGKAMRELGWRPRTSFEEMIREMVESDMALLEQRAASAR
jgi:GDPmannose 4,6-dehydratase